MENTYRRVVVAADLTTGTEPLFESAAELAESLGAELYAIFWENTDLINMTALPLARELLYGSVLGTPFEKFDMERRLKYGAQRLQQNLIHAAQKRRLHYQFRVTRGQAKEVITSVEAGDILIWCCEQQQSSTRIVIEQTGCSVVYLRKKTRLEKPVIVFFEAGIQGERALHVGCKVAKKDGMQIVVVLQAERTQAGTDVLKESAHAILTQYHIAATLVSTADYSPETVDRLIKSSHARLVIVPGSHALLKDERMDRYFEKYRLPVLVIR